MALIDRTRDIYFDRARERWKQKGFDADITDILEDYRVETNKKIKRDKVNVLSTFLISLYDYDHDSLQLDITKLIVLSPSRWQVDHASKYTIEAALKENNVVCDNPAVSDVKLWLCEKQVFSYVFKNGKSAVLQALEIIEHCKQEEEVLEDGTSLQTLESRRDELKKKRKKLLALSLEDDYDMNDYKELKAEIDEEIATIEDSIAHFEIEKAKQQKKVFNIEDIRQRLNTIINLRDYKVSDEVIDMFVERIIYRGVVDGNDEFVWVMNLSGECTDTSAKYKIRGYDKNYADSLKSDRNFNIVARMLIPMEECKRFCQEEAGRRFKKKYWNPITIKIAIA